MEAIPEGTQLPGANGERPTPPTSEAVIAGWRKQEHASQVRRLRTFLRFLLVPFFVFGPADLLIGFLQKDPSSTILGGLIIALIPGLLWSLRELRKGNLDRAAAITVASILAPALVIVFLRPFLFPVLAVGTILATAIALPFVKRRTLTRLLGLAFADAVAICALGAVLLPPSEYYVPGVLRSGLTALSLSVVIGLVLLMLGLFSSRLVETLNRTNEAHTSLAMTLDEMRAMDQRRTQFMSATAHEIFTPLTPIRIQLHLLQSDPSLTNAQKESVQMIERNFVRLSHLAGDLLDTTRVEAGKLRLTRSSLRLGSLAAETLAQHQAVADGLGVRLSGQFDDSLLFDGDPQRLAQVFDNLVGNALKFTPRGGAVHVELSLSPEWIRFSVRDNGEGIPSDLKDRLFRPFSQLSSPERGGTGLGLFISKGIVEAHGGRIRAESEGPGHGSCFIVELPRLQMVASAPQAVATIPA